MRQLGDGLCFRKEELLILLIEWATEDFDRGRVPQVDMLSQVDFCERTFPQKTVKMIVPDSLSFTY